MWGTRNGYVQCGGKRYAVPDPEWDFGRETYAARNVPIGALLDRGITTFNYTYDFGDDWRYSITVEVVRGADPAAEYLRFVDGDRRAPPEDVGGLSGFQTSSMRWQSLYICNIAKSWDGMAAALSQMISLFIQSIRG